MTAQWTNETEHYWMLDNLEKTHLLEDNRELLKDLTAKSKRNNYVSLMKHLYRGLSRHGHVPSVLS